MAKSAASKPVRKTASKAHTLYHKDGTVWAKGRMTGARMSGFWQWFRKDGTLMRSGSFKDGEPAGEWTTFDKAGKVFKVTVMDGTGKRATNKMRNGAKA